MAVSCGKPGMWKKVIVCHDQIHEQRALAKRFFILPICWILLASYTSRLQAEQPSEYRLKVAFLYNFVAYAEWPTQDDGGVNFCIYGKDPFGQHIQHLRERKINDRSILIRYVKNTEALSDCQVVFISQSITHHLEDILKQISGKSILTISDSPGAARQGVVINMSVQEGKVIFEVNIKVAHRNGLKLSSQLLRFASEVYY